MTLRKEVQIGVDRAIQAGHQPKTSKNGLGLQLEVPGGRLRTLIDKSGIKPAGTYYYQKTGLPQPKTFDYNQDSVRKGRSQFITTLDGSQKKISTWNPIIKNWKLTKLGEEFYSKQVDRFVINWPARIVLTRTSGSLFERDGYLASNAVDLGEIEVPRMADENQQRAKVAQIERAWRDRRQTWTERRCC